MSMSPDSQASGDEEEDKVKAIRTKLAEVRSRYPKAVTKCLKASLDCDLKMATTFAVELEDDTPIVSALKSLDGTIERMNLRKEVKIDNILKKFEDLENQSNNLSKALDIIQDLSGQCRESQ